MVGVIVIIIAFMLMVLMNINYVKEFNKIREEYREDYAELLKKCGSLESDNMNLRVVRRESMNTNTLLADKNTDLTNLLHDIADRAVTCPLNSEKSCFG